MRFFYLLLLVCAGACCGCSSTGNRVVVAQAEQKRPSIQLDAAAKRKLVEKATTLKVGDSIETVTNALGTPTFNEVLARKESDRVIGRSLKYYAFKWDRRLVNEVYDQLVEIFLDEHDRVQEVYIRVTLQ